MLVLRTWRACYEFARAKYLSTCKEQIFTIFSKTLSDPIYLNKVMPASSRLKTTYTSSTYTSQNWINYYSLFLTIIMKTWMPNLWNPKNIEEHSAKLHTMIEIQSYWIFYWVWTVIYLRLRWERLLIVIH